MGARSPRMPLMAGMTVLVVVCAVSFLHALDPGLYPDGMESWLENNRWPMWTAAALTVPAAPAFPLLGRITPRPGEDR
ncbi:hypothetical protein [Streptomyces sp. G-5]|uniref:hypothetical protein n=1 Tax=Streptomyces sp. G-5 TaxID=2977231 RepID=UPI0021CEE99F|nr:hypothetical protein [Streptomyces sp. G-5]MCU4749546.1 hypothetical protein [Streptomyces sp. G-5]